MSRALKTGLCVVKRHIIGTGKKAKVIEEYEVDTGLLNAMADLEKQVAIETGQWTEKQDLSVNAEMSERSRILAKAYADNPQELEAMLESSSIGIGDGFHKRRVHRPQSSILG